MKPLENALNLGEQPPRKMMDPYKIPVSAGALLFVVSILVHLAFGLAPFKFARNLQVEKETMIPDVELQYLQRPVIETLQQTAKEKPKNAKLESSRNLTAEEDTSPVSAPSNLAQLRGEKDAASAKPKSQPKEKSDSGRILSFTSEDMVKEDNKRMAKLGDGGVVDSAGFMERLKRGQQLKVSALESDYAQYINRMKRKISQRWNPQRVINAKMYDFDEVSVDVALILNPDGEIVELKVINQSNFSDFDFETMEALNESAPFPNPPKSLIQDDGLIHMPWKFSVFMRQSAFRLD